MLTCSFMTIINLSFIPLILTIALIIALISFIIVINLNKKLTRKKNNVENNNDNIESKIAMLVTNQLVNKLNGLFEIKYIPIDETIYYKNFSLSNEQKSTSYPTNQVPTNKEVENEYENETESINKTNADSETKSIKDKSTSESKTIRIIDSESINNFRTSIDPDFLHRVTCLIFKEIANTDNMIEVISSELCISSSQLNRRIKIMTGMTTSHFIYKTRLNKAKKQLTLTQKPIGEIAAECGFNDFAYFSRSFKKEFKMTPTTFQRISH